MSKLSQGLLAFVFATLAVGVPLHGQRKTNVLTAEEIERANLATSNAYDVVEQLRPRWFATRGIAKIPGSPGAPLQGASVRVWLNEHNAGYADYLKTIPADRRCGDRGGAETIAASTGGHVRAVTVAPISLPIAALAGSAPLRAQHRPSSFLAFEGIDRVWRPSWSSAGSARPRLRAATGGPTG